jgi:hydroxyacylglutathione hydrolase
MRNMILTALSLILIGTAGVASVEANSRLNDQPNHLASSLAQKKWAHGATDCTLNTDPAIEVFQYDKSSYVLRQNKCTSYEAPFIYVLFGAEKVLIVDTGATKSAEDFPLYNTVQSLSEQHLHQDGKTQKQWLVIHSHSHGDHYAADPQFAGKPNVTVVKPNSKSLKRFFAFQDWPNDQASIELGGRKVTIIAAPGHQEEAIAIYDPQTKWLLTGDTFYPGLIYVKDWDEYKKSIARLVEFTNKNEVSAVLGAHIEMTSTAGEYYPIGTIYQPDEASLTLMPKDLAALNSALSQSTQSQKIKLDKLTVEPLGVLMKTISKIANWFS